MRRLILAVALACGLAAPAARAQPAELPSCTDLAPLVMADVSSMRNHARPRTIDNIVEDHASTPDARLCTGVGRYPGTDLHLTYSAKWGSARRTTISVAAHDTDAFEEASRALSMRLKFHPQGSDGTFSLRSYVPYCTDPEFVRLAVAELHYGISFRNAFYREPDFEIIDIAPNGYGSGILSNCVATVGDAAKKGKVFIGTNWVAGPSERRYEFYLLDQGPEGFRLTNRLWQMGTE